MQIVVNGKEMQLAEPVSIAQLLQQLELENRRLAVEVNQAIVPRSQHASHQLQTGDKIEIVHAIGGG